ncbi:MAG TPA: hypothetical protein VMS73_03165 [Anaerolineaceae bacterium]|nr:hypothetical protein [Anaerolineaceae bacterium]
MIHLSTNNEVYCSDGAGGSATHIIANSVNHQITHLVVISNLPPFFEYLVPVDQVEEVTPDLIKLKCTRNDLNEMEPFVHTDYINTKYPEDPDSPYVSPFRGMGILTEDTYPHIPVTHQNIPQGESALRYGARVEATNGYVGQVDELLVNSKTMQLTHLVLLERHIFKNREITIPVSQIDHVFEDTVYLKLDQQSVEALPSTPFQRRSQ